MLLVCRANSSNIGRSNIRIRFGELHIEKQLVDYQKPFYAPAQDIITNAKFKKNVVSCVSSVRWGIKIFYCVQVKQLQKQLKM